MMDSSEQITRTRGVRKTRVGRVVSDVMDKTAVVEVLDAAQHPTYGKIVRRTKHLKAHDENNDARIGDTVRIEEARPLSATKRWRLVEIVQRAGEGAGEPILSEEEATSEAIHMAAHPGRHDATEIEVLDQPTEAAEAGSGVIPTAEATPATEESASGGAEGRSRRGRGSEEASA
jgi:small subunit ribosomal protein S17